MKGSVDPLVPCDRLEKTLRVLHAVLGVAGVKYWLGFGGLYGLIRNNGVIPDADLDICTLYGTDYKRILKAFASRHYVPAKVVLDDTNLNQALYVSLNHPEYVHICLSFWIERHGIRWYCHDEKKELTGPGVPPSGYWFKGVDARLVNDPQGFKSVEWPGLSAAVKIRVPLEAGSLLDQMYIGWPYKWQRYNVENHEVQEDKMMSYYEGGAISRYMVHLKSVADFDSPGIYEPALEEGLRLWKVRRKKVVK